MPKLLMLVLLLFVAVIAVAGLSSSATAAEADFIGIQAADLEALPVLGQASDNTSSPRISGRGVRGLIYVAIAAVGGVVWLVKKMFGVSE